MTSAAATTSTSASPLNDPGVMANLIAETTGRSVEAVHDMLRAEYQTPGITVAQEFHRRGLTPYVMSEGLEAFYCESDAFIFESAVWNRNRIKANMRRWVGQHLDALSRSRDGKPLDVLCIGDGLGFDSASFASRGHTVTYHEVPGPHEAFAREVFARSGQNVKIVTDHAALDDQSFDVIVCLDVLEHVPDVPSLLAQLVARLRPMGRLVVHAPFYMIHPAYPTHLKRNRIYSGSLQLYVDQGLKLVDGCAFFNPLVWQRSGEHCPQASWGKQFVLRICSWYLALGRLTALPMYPIHWYRRARGRWFG